MGGTMSRPSPDRIRVLRLLFFLAALAVEARLFWVQVYRRDQYLNPTNVVYHRHHRLAAEKGEMRDRNGRSLARSVKVTSIAANPLQVVDAPRTARLLSPYIGVPEATLLERLTRYQRPIVLRSDVPATVIEAVRPLLEAGILQLKNSPAEDTYAVFIKPSRFQPTPSERARLVEVLGEAPPMALRDEVTPWRPCISRQTRDRLKQLNLDGLNIQKNPSREVPTLWLNPDSAAIDRQPVVPGITPRCAAEWHLRLRPEVYEALAPIWGGAAAPSLQALEAKLRVPFVYLRREVPDEVAETTEKVIAAFGLTGVAVVPEFKREYPQGPVGRLLLGRTDVDERGVSGLELLFDEMLTGVDGYRRVTVTRNGKPIAQEREEHVPPVHGKSVQLTIDAVIQSYAESALQEAVDSKDADWGIAVVIDPTTGEVYALANAVSGHRSVPVYDRCLTHLYEPGSVLKPVVAAAALEAGVTSPDELFYCPGHVEVGRSVLRCIKQHGPETVFEAVRDSCNVVMTKLSARLGQERLQRAFEQFGLLRRTGLVAPDQEACGVIHLPGQERQWSPQKLATVAYGKGIACTAVELAQAYGGLINGGVMPPLRIVRRVVSRDGRVAVEPPSGGGSQVISAETSAEVLKMLRAVVAEPQGTGRAAASEQYEIAGKTGTSLGYREGDPRIVSFVGFAPYDRPRLLVLMSVAEPRIGERTGASTCAGAVRTVLERSLHYLAVPPSVAAQGGGDAAR